ncbi:hypothetical protein EXN22_16260 [Pseudomonas tructae]|uniref:Uncharacterized protein n=1 Tax=Pseudomonas tructae TaxID=2518644 RepID=A0A411MK75_9PSED|nr:hypothetical protein [Pseudomonas tructae]QBF27168.1 hypothetical protein EXN22_16260 [Pseudomonas tructae]
MTMTSYEVSTPDGVLHLIEAVTHVRDSNGLTLLVDGGKAVAMFPVFSWMRMSAQVAASPEAGSE